MAYREDLLYALFLCLDSLFKLIHIDFVRYIDISYNHAPSLKEYS